MNAGNVEQSAHTCGKEKKCCTGVHDTSGDIQKWRVSAVSDGLVDSPVLRMKEGLSLYNADSEYDLTHVCCREGGGNRYIVNFSSEPVGGVSMLYHHRKSAYFDSSTPPKVISPFVTPSVDEGA